MKNFCYAFAMLLCISTASQAQDSPKKLSAEAAKQCTELTRLMAKNLYLYDAEYLKLKVLNEKTMLKVQEIYAQYIDSPTQQEGKLKEAANEIEIEIKKMLDEQQQVALASYKIDASLWLNTPAAIKNMMSATEEK